MSLTPEQPEAKKPRFWVDSSESRTGIPEAVAQVLDSDGHVAGAGFLVDHDLLVTCAHVVEAAGSGRGGGVTLVFPRLSGQPRLRELLLTGGLRRLPRTWPSCASRPRHLARRICGWGRPQGAAGTGCAHSDSHSRSAAGHFAYAVAGDLLPAAGLSSQRLQLANANDITQGFSGGPVFDEVRQGDRYGQRVYRC